MSRYPLQRLHTEDRADAAIVLSGFGVRERPDATLTQALVNMGLEPRYFDRRGDIDLGEHQGMLEAYMNQVTFCVQELLAQGKNVHLIGFSLGGWLAYRAAMMTPVSSVALIAPLVRASTMAERILALGPDDKGLYRSPRIAREVGILGSNLRDIPETPSGTPKVPTLVVAGDMDKITPLEDMELIRGPLVTRATIANVGHLSIPRHPETLANLGKFYE